jgi:hypothetical protein
MAHDREDKLWAILNECRSHGGDVSPPAVLKAMKRQGIQPEIEDLSAICAALGKRAGEQYFPKTLVSFIHRLLEGLQLENVLDPWAGYGLMARQLNQRLRIEQFDALSSYEGNEEIDILLPADQRLRWKTGNPLELLVSLRGPYDAVVSCPPFGLDAEPFRLRVQNDELDLRDDLAHVVLLRSSSLLRQGGIGVFILSPRFVWKRRPNDVRAVLGRCGLRLAALLHIPAGTFSPTTTIETVMAVVERGPQDAVFVGEIPESDEAQAQLVANFRNRRSGNQVSQGRLVDLDEYRGFRQLESEERINLLATRMQLQTIPASEVLLEINTPRHGRAWERFDEKPNSVYLPQMARTPATTSQDELPEGLKSYLQLVVDASKANAAYVAGFFNTTIGYEVRDRARSGTTIPRISAANLGNVMFYLPAAPVQDAVVKTLNQVHTLQSELAELETRLLDHPADVGEIVAAIGKVNREERFHDWLESLPFPLASILWAYHAEQDSDKSQYERLLHFFEALAEFLAVVLLSGFATNEVLWLEIRSHVNDAFEKQGLSFDRATFGTWKCVVETLAKRLRTMANSKDELETCKALFKTRDMAVIEAICSRHIVGVFQKTNALRNDWKGHTGAVSTSQAAQRHELLKQYLASVRKVFGTVWENYELLLPGSCTMAAGVFRYSARRIMGTRSTPFPTVRLELTEPMESDQLHLRSKGVGRALKLLPFIKVMPSPRTEENACYFYNRREKQGIRFLSYHFEVDADVTQLFEDTAKTLDNLTART